MEPLHIHEVHLWCARPETPGCPGRLRNRPGAAHGGRSRAPRALRPSPETGSSFSPPVRSSAGWLSRPAPVAPEDWRFGDQLTADAPRSRETGVPAAAPSICQIRGAGHLRGGRRGRDRCRLEPVRRADAPLHLADHYFAPAEIAALRALPPPAQSTRFFEYWTLKESYLKARGVGLGPAFRPVRLLPRPRPPAPLRGRPRPRRPRRRLAVQPVLSHRGSRRCAVPCGLPNRATSRSWLRWERLG